MNKKKIFVLDTNVILHDYKSIYKFEENDIIIPLVVLEELDKFKKGNDMINFHAREFMRELDKLTDDAVLSEGIILGEGLGRLFIETGKPFSERMQESFIEHNADNRILAVTEYYSKHYSEQKVILVSKDINLRMKARSLGLPAQDYRNDKVINIERFYRNFPIVDVAESSIINTIYKAGAVGKSDVDVSFDLEPNDYFMLRNGDQTVMVRYNAKQKKIEKVSKKYAYNISPRNAEQTFALDALTDDDIQLVTLTGKAGTGKTLLALAAALEQRHQYAQIYLARPIVPLANRDLGFLPGDEKAKIGPYMQPLFDNLQVIKQKSGINSKDTQRIEEMLKTEKLLITPLAYIRGRSLSNVYFIVDEAQNLTPHEIKTIITRAGEGTKMVFTGDIEQIDSPYLDSKSNGLSYLTDKMKGQDLFAHINLVKGERSYLADLASKLL